MKNICICGGGNLGHVAAGFIAARTNYKVSLLTRHPEQWGKILRVTHPQPLPNGRGVDIDLEVRCLTKPPSRTGKATGRRALLGNGDGGGLFVCSDPSLVIPTADLVLLCLPGFAIAETLQQIQPHLKPGAAVGSVVSSTGFFFQAIDILPPSTPLFGLQRVPFIARTLQYGHAARIMGFKPSLQLAVEQTTRQEELRQLVQMLFCTPTHLLHSHYEASLSNSNPLLHPSRLYTLFRDWHPGIVYPRVPLFYEEWTEEAAQLYIDMDCELQHLLAVLPVTPGSIPTVLDYYESTDAPSLASKLRSIEAFKGIVTPMLPVEGGYIPNFQSRYFTEDFPYGLDIVCRLARQRGVRTPVIDRVSEWGRGCTSFTQFLGV